MREAFLTAGHGCHIDLESDRLYGDLPDLPHDYSAEARRLGHFRFAFNDTMLIGARKQPLQSVDTVRKAIENGSRQFRSPAELIEAVMGQSLDGLFGMSVGAPPLVDTPMGFSVVSAASLLIAAVTYFFVRRLGRM